MREEMSAILKCYYNTRFIIHRDFIVLQMLSVLKKRIFAFLSKPNHTIVF